MNINPSKISTKEGDTLVVVPKWFLIGFFVFISVSLMIGGILFYNHQALAIREVKSNELKSIAQLKVNQIIQWRNERLGNAQLNSASPFMSKAVNQWLVQKGDIIQKNNILEMLQLIKDIYVYQDAFITTSDGRLLISLDPGLTVLELETQQLAKQAGASGKAVFGDFFRSRETNQVYIDVAAPILDENKQPEAVLVLRADPENYLYPLIQSWPTPSQSAETLLIRKEGTDALYLNTLRHSTNPPLTVQIPLTNTEVPAVRAVLGQTGEFGGTDYRGVNVLAYLLPVPDTPWFMVAKVDSDEILAEARSLELAVLLFVVFSMLITALLAVYFYNLRQRLLYQNLFQSEKERREAQEETRTTLYSIGDGVITTDQAGRITRLNPIAEHLTGWNESEAQGKPLEQVFHIINELTRTEVENPVVRVLREGLVVGLANHTLLIARDKTECPIADSGAPIRDEKDNITGVVLVFHDQTGERAAQKERALLTYTIGNSLNEIYLFDATSLKFRYVNNGGLNNLGYSLDQMQTMTPLDIKPEFTHESFQTLIQPLLDHMEPALAFETIHRRVDGSFYPVEVHMQLFEYEGERVFLSVIQDITVRKHADEALRKTENLFHIIFDHANDAIDIANADDQMIQVNPRMCELMGYSRNELLNMFVADLQAPEVRGLSGNVVYGELGFHGNNTFEGLNLHSSGRRIPVEISVSRVESAEGDLYISVVRDITERKQNEAKLTEQLEELRRWHAVTLGRETRILELKQEVNELLTQAGLAIRYRSLEDGNIHE